MPKVICHDKDKNEKEFDADELAHRPSVYGLLIEDGRILMSKQDDGYDFPGGGINIDETISKALEREFWEETGVKVKPTKLLHCDTSFYIRMNGQPINATLIYYLCQKVGGELSKDNLDNDEMRYADMPEWVDLKNLEQIKFSNGLARTSAENKYSLIDNISLLEKALKEISNTA